MSEEERDRALCKENQILRDQLRFYQEYDLLTGLYNRRTFYEKAGAVIRENPRRVYQLVCVDVERFKLINDLFGRERGDDLLCYLAERMKKDFYPKEGILGRLFNDVFAICLPGGNEKETEERLLRIFREYPLDMAVIPAIGFYRVTDRSLSVSQMCDWAILALHSVKGNYMKHSAVYDLGLRNTLLKEQEILNGMETALEQREFEIYMQPKCYMYTNRIVGAEALVRWNHPTRGLIPPAEFIPIFERNGFIKKLDVFVWEEAASWLRRWMDSGHPPIPVSVNISRIDVYGMDVCGTFQELLKKYDLEPKWLEIEITESAYVNRTEEVIQTMERLMKNGFTILMDDFGSGYSSLNMLKDISVNILKIDMRFLDKDDTKSKGILESVVHMSKWLNLPVIAEGVETQNQVDFLLGLGCMYAQGYFYFKPMPLKEFEALIEDCGKVEVIGDGKLEFQKERILDFHDLFHEDVISGRLLGDLLGAIALYTLEEGRLSLMRGTEEYYRVTGRFGRPDHAEIDLFLTIMEEDRLLLQDGLMEAKNGLYGGGVEVCVRQLQKERTVWLHLRLFYLAEKGTQDVYYASLDDITDQMEAMETLWISEQRFRLAMEATNIVIFELDVKTRVARYSEYAQKAFALDATVANAPEGFIEQGTVCEESVNDFYEMYEAIYRGEDRASCVIHAQMADGSTAWNRITLAAVKDKDGATVKAVGMVEQVG